jgi:hypothetical protein
MVLFRLSRGADSEREPPRHRDLQRGDISAGQHDQVYKNSELRTKKRRKKERLMLRYT